MEYKGRSSMIDSKFKGLNDEEIPTKFKTIKGLDGMLHYFYYRGSQFGQRVFKDGKWTTFYNFNIEKMNYHPPYLTREMFESLKEHFGIKS